MYIKLLFRRKWFFIPLLILTLLVLLSIFINAYVTYSVKSRILSVEEASHLPDVDCILVLGCSIWGDKPSPMLGDRLERAVELYHAGASPKLLMSGDHSSEQYNEVKVMKEYAMADGVPSFDIFLDHDGFSTYDSIYRVRDVFSAHKVLIVTQSYHLYRALYLAKELGLDAYGVSSDQQTYTGQLYRECREIAARNKDFFNVLFFSPPSIQEKYISLNGNGDETNDRANGAQA